jgi:chromosomal replication initiation ATPase DnaA
MTPLPISQESLHLHQALADAYLALAIANRQIASILPDLLRVQSTANPYHDAIVECCKIWPVSIADVKGTSRIAKVVLARHTAWHLLTTIGWTVTQIAHTWQTKANPGTIRHGLQNIRNRLETEPNLASQIKALETRFHQIHTIPQSAIRNPQ